MPVTATKSKSINEDMREDANVALAEFVIALRPLITAGRKLMATKKYGQEPLWALTGLDLWPHRKILFDDATVVMGALLKLGWVGLVRGSQSGSNKKPSLDE